MSRMYVKAIKLTDDPHSTKVAYEKNGKLYVRSGNNKFSKGIPSPVPLSTLYTIWGFRKVTDAPYFYDGQELWENIQRFQMTRDGTVKYFS